MKKFVIAMAAVLAVSTGIGDAPGGNLDEAYALEALDNVNARLK